MMTLILAPILGYLLVAGVVYRVTYAKTMARYLRWKNNGVAGPVGPRRNALYPEYTSYNEWLSCESADLWPTAYPVNVAAFWLPALVFVALRRVLRPEVKIPDAAKIYELESL